MRTKKISLYYALSESETFPPTATAMARKEAWLKEIQRTIGGKAGETRTIKVTYELFNPEVERVRKFFEGAVVDYWIIQNNDMVSGEIPRIMHDQARETLLSNTLGYDVQLLDRKERRRKSTADFISTQHWHDFLETLRETEFEPNGFEFPDSKVFWEIAEKHGLDQAKRIATEQLRDRMKAKMQG